MPILGEKHKILTQEILKIEQTYDTIKSSRELLKIEESE
jgi:hypothetical protein